MLKLRLQRVGRRNDPSFRLIVTESTRSPKSGRHIELLGSHNPRKDATALKADRIRYWLEHGARASGTVHNLLVTHKVIDGKKVNVLPQKSPVVKEEERAEAPAADEAISEERKVESKGSGAEAAGGQDSGDFRAEAEEEASGKAEEKEESEEREDSSKPSETFEVPKEESSEKESEPEKGA